MSNLISARVADFLRRFPPFEELTARDLEKLSLEVEILYKEKGAYVFRAGDAPHSYFYVVHKGAADLRRAETLEMVDICDEGDIFGLRPLMAGEHYRLEARAREESILYAIPIEVFRPFVTTYEEVGNFLIESFASNTRNPYSKEHSGVLFSGDAASVRKASSRFTEMLPVVPNKRIISCTPETPVREVAALMRAKNVGSVLILEENLPVGIITDKDLRDLVVTGQHPITAPAREVMTRPVITYPQRLTISQAQLAMMKNDIGHLCLTRDGTPDSPVTGVLSKYDLMLAMGNNPEVLMRAIKRCRKIRSLKPLRAQTGHLLQGYLDHNIPVSIVLKLISELNDACIKRVIALSLKKEGPAPVDFAWLSMGSQGRGEQLLQTDQDTALVFENVPDHKLEQTTSYFLNLAERVTRGLKQIGFEYCPAEMMASNPDWCLSLGAWKEKVAGWIRNPGADQVLLSSIFFDYNLTYGSSDLVRDLSEFIFGQVEQHPEFCAQLASGALQNPSPTGFFRQFLVEQDGKYKDFFDIKKRALMPLTDAARVLVLFHRIKSINGTAERYEKLAELEPNNRELFLSCSYATKALLKFRTRQGLIHGDSGRYIALDTLSKEEKVKLKRTFKTIKEVQELLAMRFKITPFPI